MTLEHLLVEICREENAVGGILAAALCNRVRARLVAEGVPPPDQEAIQNVIYELIANQALVVTDSKRLRARNTPPTRLNFQAPRRRPQLDDILFNEDGEPVAMITKVKVDDGTIKIVAIEVKPIVDLSDKDRYLGSRDTHIHGYNDIPAALQRAAARVKPAVE